MILVNTGPVVAVVNDRDDRHREGKYLLERLPGPLLIPATVATEVCVLLECRTGHLCRVSVFTLDRRDFSIVRPSHVSALTLLP